MALGVIGGVGPMATAYFMERVVTMTEAAKDQEHLEMLIYNCPSIPDRTAYITGTSDVSPVPKLIETAQTLQTLSVDSLCILCITAHTFYDEIAASVDVPVINIIQETTKLLKEKNIRRAGVLATDGTLAGGAFQNELRKAGIEPVLPSSEDQQIIMDIIYRSVKADRPVDINALMRVSYHLTEAGAEILILGCTELSVVKNVFRLDEGYLDVLDVLARKVILDGGKRIKQTYQELIP